MSADIDIDVPNRDAVLALIQHTAARQNNGRRHNSGIYVTDIPRVSKRFISYPHGYLTPLGNPKISHPAH